MFKNISYTVNYSTAQSKRKAIQRCVNKYCSIVEDRNDNQIITNIPKQGVNDKKTMDCKLKESPCFESKQHIHIL